MADQSIKINIGSSYDGSGMSRAMGGLNNLSQKAGRASSAIGSLAGAFSGLDGAAGKAVGAVSRLTGALSMGGPIGLAIAGVTALVGMFQSYKEKQEKAAAATEEAAKKVKKLQEEAAKKAWNDFVAGVTAGRIETDKLAASLDKVVRLNNALASAKQANFNASGNLEIAQIAQQTSTKVNAEQTDEGKAVAQAEGDLKAVQIQGGMNVKTAETELGQVQEKAGKLNKHYDTLLEKHDELERQADDLVEEWKKENETKIRDAAYESKQTALKIKDIKTEAQIAKEMMERDAAFQKKMQAVRDEQSKINDAITASGGEIAVLREEEEAAQKKLTAMKVKAATDEENARIKLEQAQNNRSKKQAEDRVKAYEEEEKKRQEEEDKRHEEEQRETDNFTAQENADREALRIKENEERAKQLEGLKQSLVNNLERIRKTDASNTQQLTALETQRQQIIQRIADVLGMTNNEIKKKQLGVAVTVNGGGGGGNNNGGNSGGGSLFDPAGAGQPNGGAMPWERNRAEGPASNNTDNQNGGVFARPRGWIERNARSHRGLWRRRGWDPDTGKSLEGEKQAQVNIADKTMNALKAIIEKAQEPHIAK